MSTQRPPAPQPTGGPSGGPGWQPAPPFDSSGHQSAGPGPRPSTGDPAIDAVLAELAGLDGRPLDQQLHIGDRAHRLLSGRLRDLGGA